MAVMHIEAEIPWRIDRADRERWVGICDPLGLTVESETWAELMEDIALTLDAMLNDLLSSFRGAVPFPTVPGRTLLDCPHQHARSGSQIPQRAHSGRGPTTRTVASVRPRQYDATAGQHSGQTNTGSPVSGSPTRHPAASGLPAVSPPRSAAAFTPSASPVPARPPQIRPTRAMRAPPTCSSGAACRSPDKQAWPTVPWFDDAPVIGEVKWAARTFV